MTTLQTGAAATPPAPAVEDARNYVADRFLQKYPTDEFFSPGLLRFLIIPEGYEGVRLRLGDRLSLWGMDVGGRVKPGLRFMVGLAGLWSSMGVVDVTKRTTDLEMQQVITEGGLQLPDVDATMNWRVVDSTLAMTRATRTRDPKTNRIGYEHTTIETALARVRGYLSGKTVKELGEEDLSNRNLAFLTSEEVEQQGLTAVSDKDLEQMGIEHTMDIYGKRQIPYRPTGLQSIGTRIEELYITSIDLPDNIEADIAQRELEAARAQGQLEIARVQTQIAEELVKAAKHYEENPAALALVYNETLQKYATGPNNTIVPLQGNLGGLIDIVRNLSGGTSGSGGTI